MSWLVHQIYSEWCNGVTCTIARASIPAAVLLTSSWGAGTVVDGEVGREGDVLDKE
jgi:hypothetical protein